MKLIDLIKILNLDGNLIDGTDKNTKHSYLSVYQEIFEYFVNKEIKILEIGIQFGGSSLLWQEFFKNSKMTLIDIKNQISENNNQRLNKERYVFIEADAYTKNIYELLKSKKFDIIIDDGPHTIESQIFVIENYLNNLSIGGILVIEDIQQYDSLKILESKIGNNFESKTYDFREVKKRYDDILLIIKRIN